MALSFLVKVRYWVQYYWRKPRFWSILGQGAEPDACGAEFAIPSVQASCNDLKRQAWRSVTLRFDRDGNIGWYRMDNFWDNDNEVGTSANEYVASFGNKVISMIDEGFGFGVIEYIDPTLNNNCVENKEPIT